jgi:hypothetical protein
MIENLIHKKDLIENYGDGEKHVQIPHAQLLIVLPTSSRFIRGQFFWHLIIDM